MTLAQFVDYVRNRHNAVNDNHWSDAEIYAMITARANEVLTIIGLIEATDTSTTTVASTQSYSIPSDANRLRAVLYDGELLQSVDFREWETEKAGSTTPEGTPTKYVQWNEQVLLIPIPDDAKTLTFYYYKEHPFIDGTTQTTIDIPSELHYRLADGVIADMFAKDLNPNMFDRYENKWINVHIPAFYKYLSMKKRNGRARIVGDSDSLSATDFGVI